MIHRCLAILFLWLAVETQNSHAQVVHSVLNNNTVVVQAGLAEVVGEVRLDTFTSATTPQTTLAGTVRVLYSGAPIANSFGPTPINLATGKISPVGGVEIYFSPAYLIDPERTAGINASASNGPNGGELAISIPGGLRLSEGFGSIRINGIRVSLANKTVGEAVHALLSSDPSHSHVFDRVIIPVADAQAGLSTTVSGNQIRIGEAGSYSGSFVQYVQGEAYGDPPPTYPRAPYGAVNNTQIRIMVPGASGLTWPASVNSAASPFPVTSMLRLLSSSSSGDDVVYEFVTQSQMSSDMALERFDINLPVSPASVHAELYPSESGRVPRFQSQLPPRIQQASLNIFGLTQIYDGQPKPLTVVTDPMSLSGVQASYDGSPNPPVNAGSYQVEVSLSNPNFVAPSFSGMLTVLRAAQSIQFGPLPAQTFGAPPILLSATASSNLPVVFSLVSGPATLSGNELSMTGVGIVTIRATQAGNGNIQEAPAVEQSFAVAPLAVFSAVQAAHSVLQYSDRVTLEATLSPAVVNGQSPALTVTFSIGPVVVGTTNLAMMGGVLKGMLSNIPVTQFPGSYPLTATFGGVNSNFNVGSANNQLVVSKEDARIKYTGTLAASTISAETSNAVIALTATIHDISTMTHDSQTDAYPGDIQKARVSLIDRTNKNVIAANLPVQLTSSGDLKSGTVVYNWPVSIVGEAQTFVIGVIVDGAYIRDDASDDTVITVSRLSDTATLSGSGSVRLANSEGLYAGELESTSDFSFHARTNRNKNQYQGNFEISIRSGGRLYRAEAESILSLVSNRLPPGGKAAFSGTARMDDITNPSTARTVGSNLTLTVTLSDRDGGQDRIGITIWDENGRLLFSSQWDGSMTVEQSIETGSINVR